jgi:sialate O-acetylesterase
MKRKKTQLLFIAILIIQGLTVAAFGEAAVLSLPTIFSDNMVIQRDKPIHIWGKADAQERIRVEFAGSSATTVAQNGHWEIWLDPVPAGGPFELVVSGENQVKRFRNVLVGDVWIASGQSNMAANLRNVTEGSDAVSLAHRQEATKLANSQIRLFQPTIVSSRVPLSDYSAGGWRVGNLAEAYSFSAVGFYFAGYLQQALDIPIGIIQLARGGSPAQAWMPLEAFETSPTMRQIKGMTEELETNDYNQPAALYNGMIAPAHNFPVKGVIWYQGERNANLYHTTDYAAVMTALINSWRQKWQEQLPFLIVQLPAYSANNTWPRLRDAQRKVALTNENVSLAVTIDTGDRNDIHPKNKMPVGYRLALQARCLVYGEDIVCSGPTIERAEGLEYEVRLTFNNIGSGLTSTRAESAGFQLCATNGSCVPAEAIIEEQQVIVWSDELERPAAVAYAWSDFPEVSLFNKEGLPAAPFYTEIDYALGADAPGIKVMNYPIAAGGRPSLFVLTGTASIEANSLQPGEKLVVRLQETGSATTSTTRFSVAETAPLSLPFILTSDDHLFHLDTQQVADGVYNLVFEWRSATEPPIVTNVPVVICNNAALEQYLERFPELSGPTGLSRLVIDGRPLGRVRLTKPVTGDIVAGKLSIEYDGVHPLVMKQMEVTLQPAYGHDGSGGAMSPICIYSGAALPDSLIYDTTQVADGAYDLVLNVTLIDGETTTVKRRIAVDNWVILADEVEPPLDSWFGEMKRMQTVAATTGWEFTGDARNILFGDADRIRRKAATEESLTWQLPRLHSFAFTVYTRDTRLMSTVQVALSSDGGSWTPVSYATNVLEQDATGWWQVEVEGTVPAGVNVDRIRFTVSGNDIPPADLELGKVLLTGTSDF